MERLPELLADSEKYFLVGTASFIGTLVLSFVAFLVAFRFASLVRGTQEIFHKFSRGLFFTISTVMFLGGLATTMAVFHQEIEATDKSQALIEGDFARSLGYSEVEEVDDREIRTLRRGLPLVLTVQTSDGVTKTIEVQLKAGELVVKDGPLPDAAF